MKAIVSLLMLFPFFMPNEVDAQIAFGPKAGLNLTTLDIDDPQTTYESRSGYHLGLFVRGRFDNMAIQPELLLFTQRGAFDQSVLGTVEERFTYLSVPIMFKFYPIGGLNLQLGPQFGFLLDGEREYDTFIGNLSQDITDYYKETDIAVSVGAGYDFPFGLGLDVRYNLGIQDINDAADGEEARSRIFLVSLGWNFLR